MEDEGRGKATAAPWKTAATPKPTLRSMVLGLMLTLRLQSSPLNISKARGDAVDSDAGSKASSYRSRRQSVGSQMSHMSHSSRRSVRSGKSGRHRRAVKGPKRAEIIEPEFIQVFNEHGKNVTPKQLVSLRPTALHERLLQIPADQFTPESERPSAHSRAGHSLSSRGSFTPETMDEEGGERDEPDLTTGKRFGGAALSKELPAYHMDGQKQVHLIYSGALPCPSEQLKVGNANFSSSYAQTLLNLQKCKEIQASAMPTEIEACQANSWDISDSYANRGQPGRVELHEAESRTSAINQNKADEAVDNTNIAGLLVSAGYLESPTASTLGTGSPNILVQRLQSGTVAGSRRGSILGNLSASRRCSIVGAIPSSTRGSAGGSILPSCRGSASGSIAGSRRGSATASLAPSRRGSNAGNTAASQRSSKLMSLRRDDTLPPSRSLIEREIVGPDDIAGSLLLTEDDLAMKKHAVELDSIAGILLALETVERALVQNNFHGQLLSYRNFRSSEIDDMEDACHPFVDTCTQPAKVAEGSYSTFLYDGISLGKQIAWLWDFYCPLTKDRNISCLIWNKAIKDLLIVGYGQFEFGAQRDGFIAFWSLKNPCYPHSTVTTASGVMALDFSSSNANLLAAGFYNGNVAVYDVRNHKDTEPVVQSGLSTGKHNDPIWKVQWIDSTSEHGESFVSISTDGRVTQWFLKKELEYVTLMTLKRVTSHCKGAHPQPFISRRAAGMCFDFSPRDPSIYLIGTEEGYIHKCSRSYNEQYLQTYVGHTGPVFQVRWSPFLPILFLSCSSDWTVRLWREEQETALLIFQSATESVGDVRWSVRNACVFGTVSNDGRLEIWDLAVSAVKPVIVHKENKQLSCLLFSEESPVVISAGNDGAASTFRLVGFKSEDTVIMEVHNLKKALAANINTLSG